MERSRNHFYLYTVGVRTVITVNDTDKNGKATGSTHEEITWPLQQVRACNIDEVAGKLHKNKVDVRYENKIIDD